VLLLDRMSLSPSAAACATASSAVSGAACLRVGFSACASDPSSEKYLGSRGAGLGSTIAAAAAAACDHPSEAAAAAAACEPPLSEAAAAAAAAAAACEPRPSEAAAPPVRMHGLARAGTGARRTVASVSPKVVGEIGEIGEIG